LGYNFLQKIINQRFTSIHNVQLIIHYYSLKHFFTLCFACILPFGLSAQKKNSQYQLHIRPAVSDIVIDGRVDDAAWAQTDTAGGFYMVLPMDTSPARVRTVIRMAYNATHLFVGAVCYNGVPGKYRVESLRRDFNFGSNDNFLLFLDPFDDRVNGFSFGLNAAGAQWDGMMFDGGSIDLNWENKWTSGVENFPDRWEFEMAIPFKTLRYKAGKTEWGVNFSRLDLKAAEKSAWAPVPRQFPTASLAYTGVLVFEDPPPATGKNISVIPYLLTGATKDHEKDKPTTFKGNIGGDAKVAITSSLNLDLTVRPDFSQVEVDQQQTNLDRFELFFPERRQFFLENGDLFNNFGYGTLRPFFSRRIGLQTDIDAGARLSGRLNPNWRIGAMTMQTRKNADLYLPAQNFSVLALQRRIFARSNVTFMAVNKQNTGEVPGNGAAPAINRFNRVAGLEYNLASANNIWRGKAVSMKSFTPGASGNDWAHSANLQYGGRFWNFNAGAEYVGKAFNPETGFVPRRGHFKATPQLGRLFFPRNNDKIVSHGIRSFSTVFWNTKGRLTDNENVLLYNASFRNQSFFTIWGARNFVELFQPFDPTNLGREKLPVGSRHRWLAWGTDFTSTPKRLFTFAFSTRYGGFYANGTRLNISPQIGYRIQPYMKINMAASYNDIRLPQPWNNTTFWLVGPRLDVTMTNKLFFTAFVQYNNQLQNVNINTRLQWRYSPASDLYLVYTDNYNSEIWGIKNRAFVLKFNYWWNV
jgi:hypothetical protein